ncbi:hypothetical protein PHLCEN_2v11120 [Hermanssonia centrifuga]|uniref:Enoyl reductase (ER) domain-containing protein n=1 Tax=Hermanssonia centrifuga TaxID=98765 RepID=A0A2R6NL11_9APHY|nr:hypothetical protein PHLCEN_2v11120 [Hermanssonia centrifuga]
MVQIPEKTRQYYIPKLGEVKNLSIRNVDVPTAKPLEVLVKVHAVSLNYRDLLIARNQYAAGSRDGVIPCSDMAGEVVAIGEDVKKWQVGDRVTSNFTLDHIAGDITPAVQKTALGGLLDGVLSEYKVFPEHSLLRIPEYMSYQEASTLPCAAVTAWNALHGPVPLKGGDYVLVQGTGGVSVFALQIAAASGATVIATSSSDDKLLVAKQLGAKHTINYVETPDWDKEVLKFTNGEGVHHIIEVGGPGTIDKSLNCIRMGGYIHVIGFLGGMGTPPDQAPLPMKVLFKSAVVRGILIGSRTQFEDMNRLFEAHQIKPVVDNVFPFDEATTAYKRLESQKHLGKIVVQVSKD